MSYRIAGIDVHKKVLAVVVSDVEIDNEYQFERRKFGSNPEQLRSLAAWLLEQEAEEVVMESTAQYWKPVWEALERYWKPICEKREGARRKSGTLHLAQPSPLCKRRQRLHFFCAAGLMGFRAVAFLADTAGFFGAELPFCVAQHAFWADETLACAEALIVWRFGLLVEKLT